MYQHRVPPRLRKERSCFGVGPTRIPPQGAGSGSVFGKTERQARGLDSVARDNLADGLMPQDRRAGRTLTQLGLGSRDWEPDYTGPVTGV